MEILVEIGTPEQQELIRKELAVLPIAIEMLETPLRLDHVIVPEDFDKKVNELQETDSYQAYRGVGDTKIAGMAKMISVGDGFVIVLSPFLYIQEFDTIVRTFIVLHELKHVVNKYIFSTLSNTSVSQSSYLGSLYAMFDEYSADRFAYRLVDNIYKEKSEYWNIYVVAAADGFARLLRDEKYYDMIRAEIYEFRYFRRNVDQFLANIKQCVDEVALVTTHLFSFIHHSPDVFGLETLDGCKFMNEKTLALMDYFRSKYDKAESNLEDGFQIATEYFTNFGFKFEDRPQGGYCHVLDI